MTHAFQPLRVRWLAWLAVCGSLCGQFAVVAHFAVVRHEVCAAHGEAIHAGSIPAHRAAAVAPTGAHQLSAAESDHEHDHCLVAARVREATLPQQALAARAPGQLVEARAAAIAGRKAAATIAALRLAPKNSPPV